MNTRPLVVTARVLAAIAAALALLAAVSGIGVAAASPIDTVMVESWRTVGFFTFAALFAYLAFRPTSVTVWVIVLANKLVLTVTALLLGSATGGAMSGAWDGALVLILAAGLVLVLMARRQSGEGAQRG